MVHLLHPLYGVDAPACACALSLYTVEDSFLLQPQIVSVHPPYIPWGYVANVAHVANSTNIINSFADILVKTCIQLACLLPAGRMPPSGKLTVLNLLTGQNSGFSPRRGGGTRCNDSRQTWLPTVTSVRLAVQNFTSIATGGTNAAPKYQKFPLFSKESPRRGDSLDRFQIF